LDLITAGYAFGPSLTVVAMTSCLARYSGYPLCEALAVLEPQISTLGPGQRIVSSASSCTYLGEA